MHRINSFIFARFFLLAAALTTGIGSRGQSVDFPLQEIRIMGLRKSERLSEMHSLTLDTILKTKYYGDDLASVIKRETNLNITQYGGQGSLTSIRMRGTSPSHTQINWNGIPINSPTTGTIDLSLVSSNLADALEIIYGVPGSLFGSGTFGGSLNLINKPDWDNKVSFNVYTELGSWGHARGGASFRTGNRWWQYQAAGFAQTSPNNYPYRNAFKPENPRELRENDTLFTAGLQQNLFIRLGNKWIIHSGSWFQYRNKDLPNAMSSRPRWLSNQQDYSGRIFTRLNRYTSKHTLEITCAWLTDSLYYQETPVQEDPLVRWSGIQTTYLPVGISSRWNVTQNIRIEGGTDFERLTATGSSFTAQIEEYRGSLFVSGGFGKNNFFTSLDLREIIGTKTGLKTLYSITARYRSNKTGITFLTMISNKFRLPTINERYWIPGGNPELLAETGTGCDLGISWAKSFNIPLQTEISLTAYFQDVNNWIQWVPTGTYWSPLNVRKVRAQGIESDLSVRYSAGMNRIAFRAMYSYTESLDFTQPEVVSRLDRQLPYVPLHLLQATGSFGVSGFESNLTYRFTGRRFSTDDHDPWLDLDPYHLVDAQVSYKFVFSTGLLKLSGTVLNLFNCSYEMVRAYPSPGISFYLSAIYMFNKTLQDHEKE